MMPIKPIARIHVGDAVFEQLKAMILNGEWPPGSRIPSEHDLMVQFSVSRISVRAALERLKSLGLILSRQGSGTYVQAGGQASLFDSMIPVYVQGGCDIVEILEFRQGIEAEAARLACQRMTARDLDRLSRLYQRMKQVRDDPDAVSRLDLEFHLQIVRLSQNRYLYQVEQILKDILSANFRRVVDAIGPDLGIQDHQLILDAMKDRDADKAHSLMIRHIGRTADRMRDYMHP